MSSLDASQMPQTENPDNNLTLIIDEQIGVSRNQVYEAAQLYLRTKSNPNRLKLSKTPRQKNFILSMVGGEEISDTFDEDSLKLTWKFIINISEDFSAKQKRSFELTFRKEDKEKVMSRYLPFVMEKADQIKVDEKAVRLYSYGCPHRDDDNTGGGWGSIVLEHPFTFDTLAMDLELKKTIVDDLDLFVRRRDLYKKVGKAWKRGYLLYGPPGTGKSSLIAAMANYLKFDIYDLDLTRICNNSSLQSVLLSTTNRSILIIEDIDCGSEIQNRNYGYSAPVNSKTDMTLSGLLNFIDGLWSSCGDERIIIFTTNNKDRLDPALLRPGRMDVHIHMSYCTVDGFKILASNYLGGIKSHPLFGEIEGLIETTKVTPAEIAEELLKSEDVDVNLQGLVNFLQRKKTAQPMKAEQNSTGGQKSVDNNWGRRVRTKTNH